MLDRTGGEDTFALATMGAVPPWKVKSGRSTCGNTRISANKKSSKLSKIQRHDFIEPPFTEGSYPIRFPVSTKLSSLPVAAEQTVSGSQSTFFEDGACARIGLGAYNRGQ
jgi:hypothetical protein